MISRLARFAVLPLAACSLTGPDAPDRTNGCIDRTCYDGGAAAGADAGTLPDGGPIVYGDPLEGTSKKARLVVGGFRFTEGPVWIDGRLLFTDLSDATIRQLRSNGEASLFRGDSKGANGLAVDPKGRLLACEGAAKRVTRSAATEEATGSPIAETYADAPLNAPNDIVARADGNVYFTDPNYSGDPDTQDDEAVYRIAPGGDLSRVDHDFDKPNGVALSPDGARLYVVDNGAGKLLGAPLDAGGAAGAFSELASVPGGDGVAVDDAGNLYVAADAGVAVFDRTGKDLGTIDVKVKASNCTFGGADRRTLYITASGAQPDDGSGNPDTGVYSIRLNVPGLP